MATSLYDKGREKFATAQIHWINDTIKAVLVGAGAYTFNQNHEWLSDIPSVARISGLATLTDRALVSGACDAADTTFPSVSGASIGAIVIFKDTGVAATSPLLCWIDTATGLPITPNTGDIIVNWDNGANRIFKL